MGDWLEREWAKEPQKQQMVVKGENLGFPLLSKEYKGRLDLAKKAPSECLDEWQHKLFPADVNPPHPRPLHSIN